MQNLNKLKDEFTSSSGIARVAYTLIVIGIVIAGMVLARSVLIPFAMAGLFAFLFYPLAERFEKWGIPRVLAIVFCILILLLIVSGLSFLLGTQIAKFVEDAPKLQAKVTEAFTNGLQYIEDKTGISAEAQRVYIKERSSSALKDGGSIIGGALGTTGSILASVGVFPIYMFFLLFFRDKFRLFILRSSEDKGRDRALKIMSEVQTVTRAYLTGVFTVIFILAFLNTVGLLVVGVDYAIFLGCFAALLNVIPYVGVLIGSSLAILVTFLTKGEVGPTVAVFGIFAFNQFLENNFLTPKITGSKVSINPLATILALIIGSLIWGVAGMIIFIPLLGMFKVFCDNTPSLHPIGYLIGSEDTEIGGPVKRSFLDKVRGRNKNPNSITTKVGGGGTKKMSTQDVQSSS